ncbi:uncharacterized protein LOC144135092 [Amblyomma americanum]
MADSRQGGSTDGIVGGEVDEWELLPRLRSRTGLDDGGKSREQAAAAPGEMTHRGEARDEPSASTDQRCGNVRHVRGVPLLLNPWPITTDRLYYAATFGWLPLIAFLHGMLLLVRVRSLPQPTEDLCLPAIFVFMSIVHAGVVDDMVHAVTRWMRQAKLGAPFGVFLHIKLLFRLSLLAPAKIGVTMLASGIKDTCAQLLEVVTLDAHESYSNHLGHLGCLPRALPDLDGLKAHYKEGVLRAGACLYELLSTSENGELLQMHSDNYGPHLERFLRNNALGSCLWVFALCVVLLEIVALLKMALDDVAAMVALYTHYMEQRRGAVTRGEAFHAASQRCLRRTYYPLVDRSMRWLVGGNRFISRGPRQPFIRPYKKVAECSVNDGWQVIEASPLQKAAKLNFCHPEIDIPAKIETHRRQ